jgi:hypothetical protein
MIIPIPIVRKAPLAIWSMVRLGMGELDPIDFKYIELVIQDCAESNDCDLCLYKAQCAKLFDELKLRDAHVTKSNQ